MTGQDRPPRQPLLARVGAAMERPFARGIDHAAGVWVSFDGYDRHGIRHSGAKKVVSVAVFIEDLYSKGWRSLTVTDRLGEPIGGIWRDDATGSREWWVGDPS